MKKPALPVAVFLFGSVGVGLSGCPIYDHEQAGCFDTSDCAYGYSCDPYDGICALDEVLPCRQPGDCGVNETCDRFGTCSIGDCSFSSVGCVSGYECSRAQGMWECIAEGAGAGAGGDAGAEAGTSGGGAAGESSEGGRSSGNGGAAGAAAGNPGSGGNPLQGDGGRGVGGAGGA